MHTFEKTQLEICNNFRKKSKAAYESCLIKIQSIVLK